MIITKSFISIPSSMKRKQIRSGWTVYVYVIHFDNFFFISLVRSRFYFLRLYFLWRKYSDTVINDRNKRCLCLGWKKNPLFHLIFFFVLDNIYIFFRLILNICHGQFCSSMRSSYCYIT